MRSKRIIAPWQSMVSGPIFVKQPSNQKRKKIGRVKGAGPNEKAKENFTRRKAQTG